MQVRGLLANVSCSRNCPVASSHSSNQKKPYRFSSNPNGNAATVRQCYIGTNAAGAAAVVALAKAVTYIGAVQAVAGRGQNQFNFAISLAQTQISNLAASESRIRDADLALEAANLSRAQILQQAGVAALAQANSAPQAVLSLLRG